MLTPIASSPTCQSSTMAMKRKFDEFDVCDIKDSGSAIVHAELSPVKKSNQDNKEKYFNGQISDGKGCIRVVAFFTAGNE